MTVEDHAAWLRRQIDEATKVLADRDAIIERQRARYTEAYEQGLEGIKRSIQEALDRSAMQRARDYERLTTWRTALQHLTGELWS